jgi:uncharacterized membrane protein
MERVVQAFEVVGVAILAIGSLVALVGAARALARGERRSAYERARQDVGRAVLLGLEVLIIATSCRQSRSTRRSRVHSRSP